MIENDIEKYFVKQVNKIGGLAWKFTSPGTSGVPDRLLIWKGHIYFIELKRPKGELRKLQRHRCEELGSHGVSVLGLDTKDKIDDFLSHMTGTHNVVQST